MPNEEGEEMIDMIDSVFSRHSVYDVMYQIIKDELFFAELSVSHALLNIS